MKKALILLAFLALTVPAFGQVCPVNTWSIGAPGVTLTPLTGERHYVICQDANGQIYIQGLAASNSIYFASGFQTGSTTCGVQEAINSAPVTGGIIVLPEGICSYGTTIVITKNNVWLIGHGRFRGMDGLADSQATLLNYTGAGRAIRFGDGANAYQGIILEKFSLQVPNGVNGIDSLGQITNIRFRDLQVMGTALTGTGILPANAATDFGWSYDGLHVKGFAIGVDIRSGDDHHFRDSLIEFNTIGVELGTAAANTLPAIVTFGQGTRFGQNITGIHVLSGRDMTFGSVCETAAAAGSLCLWVEGSGANIPHGLIVESSWFNGNASVAINGIRLTRIDGMVIERNEFSQFGGKYILNDATSVNRVYWRTQAYTDAASEVPANVTGFIYGLRYPDSNTDRFAMGPQDNTYTATAARYHTFCTATAVSCNIGLDPDGSTFRLGTGGAIDTTFHRYAAGILGIPNLTFESGVTFLNLPAPTNGMLIYCIDCTIVSPCVAGGTGAFAKRLNGIWVCN